MWRSLGKVTVAAAGTPARATANQSDPTSRYPAHALLFQAWFGNTGKVYIMEGNNPSSSTGKILAVLAVPTTNSIPSASATVTYAPVAFNASDYYIDVDVNGDSCLVSAIRS